MTKRLFIAFEICKIQAIEAIMNESKMALKDGGIKWVDTSNMHLTLQFLGDIEENQIDHLKQAIDLAITDMQVFDLEIKGAGIFKNIQNPTVIWLGIINSKELSTIKDNLDMGLRNLHFPPEQKPFKPHLTLGRIRQINNNEPLKVLLEKYLDKPITKATIQEVILFESVLTPKGPIYKKLYISKLEEPVL